MQEIDDNLVTSHQPYWAVRGDLLARLGRKADVAAVCTRAIGLTEDKAVRSFLQRKKAGLDAP